VPVAGRRLEVGRGLGLEPLPEIPGQQRVEGGGKVASADFGKSRLARKERRQPVAHGARERPIGEVRPWLGFGRPQKVDAVAQLPLRLAPRQPVYAEERDALCQRRGRPLACGNHPRLARQHDRLEAPHAAGAQRDGLAVKRQLVRLRYALAGDRQDFRFFCRGGE
jgi:hypothetical protein